MSSSTASGTQQDILLAIKSKMSLVTQAGNLSYLEAKAGEAQVRDLPGIQSDKASESRPLLKSQEIWRCSPVLEAYSAFILQCREGPGRREEGEMGIIMDKMYHVTNDRQKVTHPYGKLQ